MKLLRLLGICCALMIVMVGNPTAPYVLTFDLGTQAPPSPTRTPAPEAGSAATPSPMDPDRAAELTEAVQEIATQVRAERKYIIAKSSIAELTQEDAIHLLPIELTRAWQEIYARHGKAEDPWFETRQWFSPRSNFREKDLSRVERDNIELLKNMAERELKKFVTLTEKIEKNGTVQKKIDLDADGREETLTIGYDRASGLITMVCGAVKAPLAGLSGDGMVYAARWDEADPRMVLLVPMLINRQMQTVHLLWTGTEFAHIGTTQGDIQSLRMMGDGVFLGIRSESVPTAWEHHQTYRFVAGEMAEVPETLYKMNIEATMRMTLTLPAEPGGVRPVTFSAGETATFVATDRKGWYALMAEDQASIGWFELGSDGKTILHAQKTVDQAFKWR